MLRNRLILSVVALMSVLALVAGCGSSGASRDNTITVGSKDFTENIVLGEMVAQMVEAHTDLKVERKLNLGGTKVNFDGIRSKNRDLDIYVEYDGTGYGVHLKIEDPITDPDAVYDLVKGRFEQEFKLTWSQPFGFNNTYALAMPRKVAEQYNIKTYTDLTAHSDKFVFGTTNEFMGRAADGFNPLVATYGFKFKDVKTMQTGLRYLAIEKGEVQVMDAYATDGKLKEFDMVVLEDDKKFFPPYNGAAIVRMDTLEKHPEVMVAINKLAGMLDDETMQEINYRIDVKTESVQAVAKDFLKSKGLIN